MSLLDQPLIYKRPECKRYVVGLWFNPSLTLTALVIKDRPDWQKGMLNGLGGHIEGGENAYVAMAREWAEEGGRANSPTSWELVTNLHFKDPLGDSDVAFLSSISVDAPVVGKNSGGEEVVILPVERALKDSRLIHNLSWIIPLAMDRLVNPHLQPEYGDIAYTRFGYVQLDNPTVAAQVAVN